MPRCPNCNFNLSKTERKSAVRRAMREKFVKDNLWLFKKGEWDLIVNKARIELGYSDKTYSGDILYGLKGIYEKETKKWS